jgi:hypothetical protein
MEPGLTRNLLHVTRADFKHAAKVFTRKRLKMGPVLMAFEGGFLSFESGDVRIVMRAAGEWQGRATFSPDLLRALATVPPDNDPIPIAYAEDRILIGGMTIPCQWSMPRQELAREIESPGVIDLLALDRTLTRAEIHGTDLGKRIKSAVGQADRAIKSAAARLVELEISEEEIRTLVEARIASRFDVSEGAAVEVQPLEPIRVDVRDAFPDGLSPDEERLLQHYRDSPWKDRTELLYRIARLRYVPCFATRFDSDSDARDETYLHAELEDELLLQFPRELSSPIAELYDVFTRAQVFGGIFQALEMSGWGSIARVILGATEQDGQRADELYSEIHSVSQSVCSREPPKFSRRDALELIEAWREGVLQQLFQFQHDRSAD